MILWDSFPSSSMCISMHISSSLCLNIKSLCTLSNACWTRSVSSVGSSWHKSFEYGWKRTILKGESRRSSKGWKRTIRDESRRSLDESRRSLRKQTIFQLKQTIFWGKADDLWVKADDPERKQTISRAESGRSCLKFLRVKTADLKGWKRTILSEFFYV